MISFLQPLALLGLAAVTIPALLHLMGRRLPPVVIFPAVRYLTDTEREHSRRLKLRNLLLLILRTALILFLVLAAARPVSPIGAGRSHSPTAVAFVIDNSLSSGAVVEGRRVLDLIREAALGTLDRLEPDDRLWVVFADGIPRRMSQLDAGRAIDSVNPVPLRVDIAAAARSAAEAVANDPQPLDARRIVVFSDLQLSALSSGDRLDDPILAWQPPPPPLNRWIDTAYSEPPVWTSEGAVVARVGGATRQPGAVRLVVANRNVARAVADSGDRVVLAGRLDRTGWVVAQVELDPDELRADDRRSIALYRQEPAAATALAGAGSFVTEAMQVLTEGGRVLDGRDVTLADRPGDGMTVVFPPADVALVGAFNRALSARGVGWRFGDVVDGEWEITGDVHPANGALVLRRHRLTGSGTVLARAGGEPWLVRAGDLVLVASRMELEWTALPVSAAFIPFLDMLINRVAARETWIIEAAPQSIVRLPNTVRGILGADGPVPVPSDGQVVAPLDVNVYFLQNAAGDTVGALQINYDARESQLERAETRQLRATLGEDVRMLNTRSLHRALFRGAGRADLTALFLAAAIAAALIELAIASRGGPARRAT